MSDFDRILYRLRQFSWMGIDDKPKALAFITVLIIFVAIIITIEIKLPWNDALSYARFNNENSELLSLGRHIEQSSQSSVPVILFIGGSTTREFSATDKYVSSQISKLCGKDVLFINAGTTSQTLTEAWAMVDSFSKANLALVIVGTNHYRFITNKRHVKLQAGNVFKAPVSPSTSLQMSYFSDYQNFPKSKLVQFLSLARLFKGIEGISVSKAQPTHFNTNNPFFGSRNYYKEPAHDMKWKQLRVSLFAATRIPQFLSMVEEGTHLWIDFLGHTKSRGIKVLFLALPYDPSMKKVKNITELSFTRALITLALSGGEIVDWRDEHNLSSNDFFDQQHLLESGRRKIADQFHELIAKSLPFCRQQ